MNLLRRRKGCRFGVIPLVPALLACAGCMVGPGFRQPKATVSPKWLETDSRVSAESTSYRDWWKAFDDPALDRLIERAYRDNLSLRGAGVRVLQARAQLGIAFGEIYPQTQQAFGSVQYFRTSEAAATGAAFKGSFNFWQSQIGAQASWELDFWGKFRRGIESADASLLSTLADYDNTLVTLTADVANSYIAIRTAEERIRIARDNAHTQEESLKIAGARFTYGTVRQLDVEQARTALLNTLASIPTLETERRQARDALSVLRGMPPSDMGDLLTGQSGIPTITWRGETGIPDGPASASIMSLGGMPSSTLRASRAWRRCVSRVGMDASVFRSAVLACSTSSCVAVPYLNRASAIPRFCSCVCALSWAMRMRSSAVRIVM